VFFFLRVGVESVVGGVGVLFCGVVGAGVNGLLGVVWLCLVVAVEGGIEGGPLLVFNVRVGYFVRLSGSVVVGRRCWFFVVCLRKMGVSCFILIGNILQKQDTRVWVNCLPPEVAKIEVLGWGKKGSGLGFLGGCRSRS